MKRECFIIATDFCADLGSRFVSLTLLDQLVFKGGECLSNLLWLSAVEQAPSILFSPFAGLLVDRIGAKRWLAGTLTCKFILTTALVFSVFPRTIISIYFFFICGSLFFTLGRLATIPLMIPRNRIIHFNALNERVAIVGGIASPFFVGWTISKISKNAALGVAGFSFLIAIFMVFMFPKINAVMEFSSSSLLQKKDGSRLFSIFNHIFKKNQNLGKYFFMFGSVLMGGGILNVSLPIIFKDRFKGDISYWGFSMTMYQIGALLSTLLLPRCMATPNCRCRVVSCAFFVLGTAMAIMCRTTRSFQLSWLMVLFGCGFTLMYILFESLIQLSSPAPHVGKIVSLILTFKGGCYLGMTLIGVLVLKMFNSETLLLGGTFILMTASVYSGKSNNARVFSHKVQNKEEESG